MKISRVTVVTPSFNQASYVRLCMESVAAQKGDFIVEHIILDAMSTDGSIDIIRDFCSENQRYNKVAVIEKDAGQTDAINKGFTLATGDIVCWLNTDEFYFPGALNKVVSHFESHAECDIAFGNCIFLNSSYEILSARREYFFSKEMILYYGCFVPSCAAFIRRDCVKDEEMKLDISLKVSMDTDWYYRLAKKGYVFQPMKTVLAGFVWHDSNISRVYKERARQEALERKNKYGSLGFFGWFSNILYPLIRFSWIIIRVSSRFINGHIRGQRESLRSYRDFLLRGRDFIKGQEGH